MHRGAAVSAVVGAAAGVAAAAAAAVPHARARARVVFSAIQPTGILQLGNYLGAVREWVRMQDDAAAYAHCWFSVADLHALTNVTTADMGGLRTRVRDTVAMLLACGIRANDTDRVTLFQQSAVPQHSELAWILSCYAPLGEMRRMTQFKQKQQQQQQQQQQDGAFAPVGGGELADFWGEDNARLGLLGYPALMAADILLYQASVVPVGDDQRQHLELTRKLAQKVNGALGDPPVFVVPEAMYAGHGCTRVMSLADGRVKMSKSDPNESSRILLTDSAADVRRKIARAKSDAERRLTYDPERRPDVSNLLSIFAALSEQDVQSVADDEWLCARGMQHFKACLAELIIACLEPIQAEFTRVSADRAYVDAVLRTGHERASAAASVTMRTIHDRLGLC